MQKIIFECDQGCLKCNKENKCLFCDPLEQYIFQNEKCVLSSQENCSIVDPNGNCYLCRSNYYYDQSTKKCIEIENQNLIENCKHYQQKNTCLSCQENYYIKNNQCQVIIDKIDYCKYYSTSNQCEECEPEYILDQNKRLCEPNPARWNCAYYQNEFCRKCKTGYILNYSYYLMDLINSNSTIKKNTLSQFMIDSNYQNTQIKQIKVCEDIKIQGCIFPISSTKCARCLPGYILTSSQTCEPFQLPQIQNCQFYQAIDRCKICKQGYFLKTPQLCQQIVEIENCIEYDGSQSISTCKICSKEFYLLNLQCVKRLNSLNIKNCEKLNNLTDHCQTCEQGYFLTSDKIKCFPRQSYCEKQVEISSSDKPLCEKCQSGYLLQMYECQLGKIQNCQEYNQSLTNCKTCMNKFYLDKNQCFQHKEISNCLTYSKSLANTCVFCNENNFNFKLQNECQLQKEIPNCIEYSQTLPLSCIKCSFGYYSEESQCLKIPILNCAIYDSITSKCIGCMKNYALNTLTDIQCQEIFDYQKANCDNTNVEIDGHKYNNFQVECNQCVKGSYPIYHNDLFICFQNKKLPSLGFTTIDKNCIKYTSIGICIQCKYGFYLEKGKCVLKCQNGISQAINYQVQGSGQNMEIYIKGYNQCYEKSQTNDGREIMAIDITGLDPNNLDIIIKCKQGFLPIVYTLDTGYTTVDYNLSPSEYGKNIMNKKPAISICFAPTGISQPIPYCQYYQYVQIKGNFVVKCLRCEDFYYSKISKDFFDSQNSKNSYFLNFCERMGSCQAKQVYGLDMIWSKFFSCYFCSSQIKIPFLAILMESQDAPLIKEYSQYNINQLDKISNPANISYNLLCLQDTPESFGYNKQDPAELQKYQALPDFCSLGVINLSDQSGNSLGNRTSVSDSQIKISGLSQFCASCKQGYKSTPLNSKYFYIKVKCEKIQNCIGEDWFNYCSQCQNQYSYLFTDSIDYTQCVPQIDINCFATNQQGICQFCKKGFFKNIDNKCESLQPQNCKSSYNFNSKIISSYKKNIEYLIYYGSEGIGCNLCQDGFSAVEARDFLAFPYVCTNSEYLKNLPEITNFIKNCENYSIVNKKVICNKCDENSTILKSQQKCVNQIDGCLIAFDNNTCEQCQMGKVLVNGFCQTSKLINCLIPNSTLNVSQQRCLFCEPNYYVSQNYECILGDVFACQTFDQFSSTRCLKCLQGYALYQDSKKDLCYKIDDNLNCQDGIIYNSNEFGGEFKCTKCKQKNAILINDKELFTQQTICMAFDKIQNCLFYDKNKTIETSTFLCSICNSNFWLLDKKICMERVYLSPLCKGYNIDREGCNVCNDNAFLDITGFCLSNPSGFPGCTKYSEKDICSECQTNFYLLNNVCQIVPEKNRIINCNLYDSENSCQQCQKNYYLFNNTCLPTKATNCNIARDENNCENCTLGYKLQKNNDITSCMPLQQQFCQEFDIIGDLSCKRCQQGYYLTSDKQCMRTKITINKCIVYDSENTCQQCDIGFTLTINQKMCLDVKTVSNFYDENCSDFLHNMECSICRPGSFWNGLNCISCGDQKGCFLCDNLDITQCLLCNSGYYMNKEQECIKKQKIKTITDSKIEILFKNLIILLILLQLII